MPVGLDSRHTVPKNWETCLFVFSQILLSSSKSESEIADWQSETSDPCLLDWTVGTRYQKTGKPVCFFSQKVLSSSKSESEIADWPGNTSDPWHMVWGAPSIIIPGIPLCGGIFFLENVYGISDTPLFDYTWNIFWLELTWYQKTGKPVSCENQILVRKNPIKRWNETFTRSGECGDGNDWKP